MASISGSDAALRSTRTLDLGMRLRHILGFLLAPALAILMVSLGDHLTELHAEWEPLRDFEDFALPAYAATLMFGVPLHVILRRRHFLQLWHYAIAGLAIGVIASIILVLVVGLGGYASEAIRFALVSGAFGVLVAAIFWRIAIYLRA